MKAHRWQAFEDGQKEFVWELAHETAASWSENSMALASGEDKGMVCNL